LLAGLLGCAPVPRALHPDAAGARAAADDALLALALRFGTVEMGPRFAALRPRLARAGLVPSRAFDDASIWTGTRGETREVGFHGTPLPGLRYGIEAAAQGPTPAAAGEYRGSLELTRLRAGEFEWHMDEALALGGVRVGALNAASDVLFRLAERTPAGDARAALRESLPRTAASLGRAFSLERLNLTDAPDGGRSLDFESALHPEWLRERMPRYAEFLKRYVAALQLDATVEDPPGTAFWEAAVREGGLKLRLKLRDGRLLPLAGPERRLADRCTTRGSFTIKAGLFRIGFAGLVGDVTLLREPERVGFRAEFRKEPDWRIPFLIEPFVRGSLRRPFEREGASLEFVVQDGARAEAPTTAEREYRLAVKESWLVRWLGGNVGTAVSDFRRGAEAESDRFVREAFLALREDVGALLAEP
jgi:hypothetical protein